MKELGIEKINKLNSKEAIVRAGKVSIKNGGEEMSEEGKGREKE